MKSSKVKSIARKTRTGNMQHAVCPCVLRGNNGKQVKEEARKA